jgi:hypothetical protein
MPLGLSTFGYGSEAFLEVARPQAFDLLLYGEPQAGLGIGVPRGFEGSASSAQGQGGLVGDSGCELGGSSADLGGVNDSIGQADSVGLVSVDDLSK